MGRIYEKQRRRSAEPLGRLISTIVFHCLHAYGIICLKFQFLAIFYGCTVWFVSDMVGYPRPADRFSHDKIMTGNDNVVNILPESMLDNFYICLSFFYGCYDQNPEKNMHK